MQVDTEHFERANALLNEIMENLSLKNDAALSRALKVEPPAISKIRNGHQRLGDNMLIRLHEMTDRPIREMKARLGADSICRYWEQNDEKTTAE